MRSGVQFLLGMAAFCAFSLFCSNIVIFKKGFHKEHDAENFAFPSTTRNELVASDPWNCTFEDDFLHLLYKSAESSSSKTDTSTSVRVTLVTEFYQSTSSSSSDDMMKTMRANIRNNRRHARFVYVLGDSRHLLEPLLDFVRSETAHQDDNDSIAVDVYYAPGGVTYRHLFASASIYPETFLVHNNDIAVGNLSRLLDACGGGNSATEEPGASSSSSSFISFDDAALMGSRADVHENTTCERYSRLGSFDTFMTSRKNLNCDFFNNLQVKPYYWGVENVVASLLPKATKANLCPYWSFSHYHQNGSSRGPRIRINHGQNSWAGVFKDKLARVCNLSQLEKG